MKKPIKLDKILKYYDWISKLEDLCIDDINELFEISNSCPLTEGIHTSFDKDSVLSIFKKRYLEYVYDLDKDGSIYIYGNLDNNFKDIMKLVQLCGWFPSNISINQEWNIFVDKNIYSNINGISIEPTKDIIIKNKPKVLYHVSDSIYDKKIFKIGLIPKSKFKLSNHPDRIYLTDSLDVAKELKSVFDKMLLDSGSNRENTIWIVDSDGIVVLFSDINLRDGGFYVMSNISPNNITKLKN